MNEKEQMIEWQNKCLNYQWLYDEQKKICEGIKLVVEEKNEEIHRLNMKICHLSADLRISLEL